MSVELYGLHKCGTCGKARAWLDAHGVRHAFTDYREHPVAPATLRAWAKTLGWEKLVNRASYTWRDLTDAQKAASTDAEWLALIKAYPALVKRPVLVKDGAVGVGFTEKKFAELFGG
ncbi:MAG: Spx/MgsR family RNA polymerase-binding regulatory protein [Mizugakiibacter sp.]|uniref:Spx/MgsR family RNA polymerase-binding regulatory protein n=1 Tax=Mizugakiibacter sp. TaxID=1972610 RepID=UPI0031BED4BF|nr:Spx/MgsR family RNA polymerase-binding regulatory protein [Xanthomonadaceae bacterium]